MFPVGYFGNHQGKGVYPQKLEVSNRFFDLSLFTNKIPLRVAADWGYDASRRKLSCGTISIGINLM
jgi:hypothetical protein